MCIWPLIGYHERRKRQGNEFDHNLCSMKNMYYTCIYTRKTGWARQRIHVHVHVGKPTCTCNMYVQKCTRTCTCTCVVGLSPT